MSSSPIHEWYNYMANSFFLLSSDSVGPGLSFSKWYIYKNLADIQKPGNLQSCTSSPSFPIEFTENVDDEDCCGVLFDKV